MGMSYNNKRPVETILVADGNLYMVNDTSNYATLPDGTSNPGNVALVKTDGTLNIEAGQLGVFDATGFGLRKINTALTIGDTPAESPEIYIAQGTDYAQSPGVGTYPLTNNRPYEMSAPIIAKNGAILTARVCATPRHNVWIVGETTAITPADETEYGMVIAFRGRRQDENNSSRGTASIRPSYTTPDYTALGTTSPLDHFIKNFAYLINKSSRAFNLTRPTYGARQPVVAFAVANSGATGTLVSGLTSGTVLPVLTDSNGNTRNLTLTAAMANSLKLALTGTHRILNINLTTAGAAADADYLVLMALDEEPAYKDKIMQLKVRIEVGLPTGFASTVSLEEAVLPYEGEGQYRQWQMFYEKTAGQRKYAQYHEVDPVIEYPSELDSTETYTAIIIQHYRNDQLGIAQVSEAPFKTIILIPCCDTNTFDSLMDVLGPWFDAAPGNVAYSGPTNRATVTITGTSGTATVTIAGVAYTATFNTNLNTTAANFVTTHKLALAAAGYSVVNNAATVRIIPYQGQVTATIANATGDLAGSVAYTNAGTDIFFGVKGAECA